MADDAGNQETPLDEQGRLRVVPITLRAANTLVKRWHRTHKPATGGLFAVAVATEGADEPCGAAIIGRPSARLLDDGWTAEVTRCVTNGHRNACSMLYGAAWRAARAIGYQKLITYTLPEEGGASLRGAGWTCVGECGGGSWNTASRPRVDHHPLQRKFRWEMVVEPTVDGMSQDLSALRQLQEMSARPATLWTPGDDVKRDEPKSDDAQSP